MARELSIDVAVDTGTALTALDRLEVEFLKMGKTAEEAAKAVEKFEKSYRENAAKADAKRALDQLKRGHEDVGESAKRAAEQGRALNDVILRYAAPAGILAAVKSTIAWADAVDEAA